MIIIVPKGTFEIIQEKSLILKSEVLGAGIGVGFFDKKSWSYGLLSYIFPDKEYDIELENTWIYSGETLFKLFIEKLELLKVDFKKSKWIITGASQYKEQPEFLDFNKRNLKMAEAYLKKVGVIGEEKKITQISSPLQLVVNGKDGCFELIIGDRIERYE